MPVSSIWPIIKILAVFLLMILMLRKKISLDITLLVSTGVLGVIFGLGAIALFKQYAYTLADISTLDLIAVLVLIMVLESVMRRTGMLKAMTDSLAGLPWNNRLLTAAIPAIIGVLPSAGGARFSAPLVGQATEGRPYVVEDKVFINYWFRHIWEFSLPLYPALIIAIKISGFTMSQILVWLWPFSVLWAFLGYWHLWGPYQKVKQGAYPGNDRLHSGAATGSSLRMLIANTWPLWATVILVFCRVPMAITLGIVVLSLIIQKRYAWRYVFKTLIERLTLRIVFLIWGTMTFKDVLVLSGAVDQVSAAISAMGIPVLAIVVIMPLLLGVMTGMVQASIGISFPLVMSIIHPSPVYVMLAYVSGTIGVMISPVHLCLVLTIEYFKADFARSYKPLVLPCLFMVLMALVVFKSQWWLSSIL
ncbi:hypothetical protein SAMN05660649_00877 [Desulfotomaculum arcticum]|uniref:DUF401 family protein n=1 Tax=Desulfotruncus arcticus DSM 17038 TaxID=1121424 RepID=A0A1I2PIB4_9FIRM|nr:DUF401 family protein [Desulfotruncus arcticus]SFG14849.1 hypothetical protein SAMN05660649_00877 [Desulfotomaculum arcticum] [Desulfotruncus arcticus DSM 17038]